MSRRGRHGHHAHSHAPGRPVHHAPPAADRPAAPSDGPAVKAPEPGGATAIVGHAVAAPPAQVAPPVHPAGPIAPVHAEPEPVPAREAATPGVAPAVPPVPEARIAASGPIDRPIDAPIGDARIPVMDGGPAGPRTTCTSAQLRRFIKSRPWVPLHELRRRFGISGDDDDVSPIRVGPQLLFIGLPPAEARMVGELLSGGDVGYELSLDPTAPIVVGVYPMRPVPRG